MDTTDETIFVSSKSQRILPQEQKGHGPVLSVLEGKGAPTVLSMQGKDSIKVGKDATCNVIIHGWLIGTTQFFLIRRKDGYYIIPQRTWARTRVNGSKVNGERLLNKGDIIMAGKNSLKFE